MAVKNSQRFAEIERLMGDYFGCHLAPVMGRVQRDLSNRQADEMRAYSNSTAGILRSLATANMPGDDPYATLKITVEQQDHRRLSGDVQGGYCRQQGYAA